MKTETTPKPYWNPYAAGIALGLVLAGSFYFAGAGLGASGGLARFLDYGLKIVTPERVNENAYLAHMGGGDTNPLDNRMVWMILGVFAGGLTSGLLAHRAKLETIRGPNLGKKSRLFFALAGGALMGFGAAMARGCTSGKALSGGAVLAVGSWTFMIMVFVGGYLIAYPFRRLWN